MLITAGEDQKIKFWSIQMKPLFTVDLRSVNSPANQTSVNRSACSLDIFCCYEPKDYLRGKIKGVKNPGEVDRAKALKKQCKAGPKSKTGHYFWTK